MRAIVGGMFEFVLLVLVAVTIVCWYQKSFRKLTTRYVLAFSVPEADLVTELQAARANLPMIWPP